MNYIFPTCKSKKVEELNNLIFHSLMNLGFPISYKGTINFKNVILTGYINTEKDFGFSSSLKKYCDDNLLNLKTIKSSIFYTFYNINIKKFNENFENVFNYTIDQSFILPSNLYESFIALLQMS